MSDGYTIAIQTLIGSIELVPQFEWNFDDRIYWFKIYIVTNNI